LFVVFLVSRVNAKTAHPTFTDVRWTGGTRDTEEIIRFRRLADLRLRELKEFGLGARLRSQSASSSL